MKKEINSLLRFPLYIFLFVLLGLFFGFVTFKILSFSRTVEVPELRGKSLVEANRFLNDAGLYLKIEGEDYDTEIPQGKIIKQDVPAGNKVKMRRGIKVVISKGPRINSVPLLVNETIGNAESLLTDKGLKFGKIITVHSDDVERDIIIAQRPEPNDPVTDTVTVIVSMGPYEKIYFCPNFKGMNIEQAKFLITKLNLKLIINGEGEIVESQNPEPGRQIKTGDTIYLKII